MTRHITFGRWPLTDPPTADIRDQDADRAFDLFFELLEELGAAGVSTVAELALSRSYSLRWIKRLAETSALRVINCKIPYTMSIERFRNRLSSSAARWAHPDGLRLLEMEKGTFAWDDLQPDSLPVKQLITVDTSNGYCPSLDGILKRIEHLSLRPQTAGIADKKNET